MKITRTICNELAQELNTQLIKHDIGHDVYLDQLADWICFYFIRKTEEIYLDPLK